MRIHTIGLLLGGALTLLFAFSAQARPEYALKHGINRCTGCHLNPVGGSVRNTNGKQYGTHGYKGGKWVARDEFGLDMRALAFQSEKETVQKGGMTMMVLNAHANLEIAAKEPGYAEVRAVVEHGLGGLGSGLRETYLRFGLMDEADTSYLPSYILVGQFHVPFGLITDEHETYTKIQTSSTWNNFEMGMLFAFDPFYWLHLDATYVNGERDGGGLGDGRAVLWGGTYNLRVMPTSDWVPFIAGVSYSEHKVKDAETRWAKSYYGIFSLDRLTGRRVPINLFGEYVQAQYWNGSTLAGKLIDDSALSDAVVNTQSEGWLMKVDFEVTSHLSLIYQYDQLAFDENHTGDAYTRHGYGFNYWITSNTAMRFRFNQSSAGHPNESNSEKKSNVDSYFIVFQTSI